MPELRDVVFLDAVRTGLDLEVRAILGEPEEVWRGLQHRRLAERVLALAAAARASAGPGVWAGPDSFRAEDRQPSATTSPAPVGWAAVEHTGTTTSAAPSTPELLETVWRLVAVLRERQNPSGLFRGGDNVDSPPDSAFSVNDLADAALLLGDEAGPLAELLDSITPALVAGGVHTPNHRWELSAALGRIHRWRPRPELRERVEQWLTEGVDIEDGLYSERSPNYAAYVSNPSLLLLADVFDRPELAGAVERNLTATLDLLLPDGSVETVLSRRQDQNRTFPLAPFLVPLRRVALRTGRGDLAWAAEPALTQWMGAEGLGAQQGIGAWGHVAAQLLLDPSLGDRLPDPSPPADTRVRHFPAAGTLVTHHPDVSTVVFGGSDYARQRRIRSGLANSPTLLRMVAGRAVLESVRLSRVFFGLGPFRAGGLTVSPGPVAELPVAELRESVSAAYYQPLDAADRRADARYELVDDGRFSAAMAFDRRPRDQVTLDTTIRVEPGEAGAELLVEVSGPPVDWCLELAFRPGGRMSGAQPLAGGRGWQLTLPDSEPAAGPSVARYQVGDDVLVVSVEDAPGDGFGPAGEAESDPRYHPGEEYEFLGGSDAAGGELLYVSAKAPARLRMRIGPGI